MDETISRIHFEDWRGPEELPAPRKGGRHMSMDAKSLWRKYAILIIGAALFTIYSILLASWVSYKTEKRVRAEEADSHAAAMEAYKEEQAQQKAAEFFLSGDASREAAINQEIDAVAPVIAKLTTDAQKLSEASCMLARVMNSGYPNTFKEVAEQALQWPLYDGKDKTFSQHDRDLAESIVRPFLESGIVPNGLTAEMVYAAWSSNDLVLRDDYEGSGTMHTWRWQG